MSVLIKVDTGFVGGVHEDDTDMSVEEWNALSEKERQDYLIETVWNYIGVYAEDEDNPDAELK